MGKSLHSCASDESSLSILGVEVLIFRGALFCSGGLCIGGGGGGGVGRLMRCPSDCSILSYD